MATDVDSASQAPAVPLWRSAGWLLLDMALVTTMQAIVKVQGETYPAFQLVFLRSLVGLLSVTPLVWRHRAELTELSNIRGHLLRVGFNSAALTFNFAAFAALPLALSRPSASPDRSSCWSWLHCCSGRASARSDICSRS